MRVIVDLDVLERGIVVGQLGPHFSLPVEPIFEVLAAHFGPDATSAQLTPPADGAALADDLMRASITLTALAHDVATLVALGTCCVVLPKLGLTGMPLEHKRKLLYALTAVIGNPSSTNPRTREVMWDVKDARRAAAGDARHHGRYWSFSETNDEATYHTDTQYFPDPERFFLLYFHEVASCGGGISAVRNVDRLKGLMMESPRGRAALDFLHDHPLPFRIPTLFTSDGRSETREYTVAPVFGSDVFCRYRYDTLHRGLEDRPEYDTPAARAHVALWEDMLLGAPGEVTQFMPRDSLVIFDNHRALHARTAFEDPNRLVVRARFHDVPGRLEMLRAQPALRRAG